MKTIHLFLFAFLFITSANAQPYDKSEFYGIPVGQNGNSVFQSPDGGKT